ncbi:MAG: arylamine N-acetyltransferase [Chloroflexota bacterium]
MRLFTSSLPPDLTERVLTKLGFSGQPEPTFGGLSALFDAWCRQVPFDNVRKLIHVRKQDASPLPGDDPGDFFEAWLKHGTGGTCWATNGALYTLLASLGFDASRGEATMMVAPNLPPNHATVLVAFDEARYIVDGALLQVEPLRLDMLETTGVHSDAWGLTCSQRDGHWVIRWRPAHQPAGLDCRIDRLQVTRETYQERHEVTRSWSPFNYELYARSVRGESLVSACFGQRVEFMSRGESLRQSLTDADRARFLVEELGMSEEIVAQLPPDITTPPPPGSNTARALE